MKATQRVLLALVAASCVFAASAGAGTTTDPDWGICSYEALAEYVTTDGPFDGLLGYSQGGAMTVTYMASAEGRAAFNFGVAFCGYVPTSHEGVAARVTAASAAGDLDNTNMLFYIGTNDYIIAPAMSRSAAELYPASQTVECAGCGVGGGHEPPTSGQGLTDVVNYINSQRTGNAAMKMLVLHGGGGSPQGMEIVMAPVLAALNEGRDDPDEFVYGRGAYPAAGGTDGSAVAGDSWLWLLDPGTDNTAPCMTAAERAAYVGDNGAGHTAPTAILLVAALLVAPLW